VRALPQVKCYYSIHEFLAICHHHGQMVTRPAQILCTQASAEGCTTCYPQHLRTQFALRKRAFLEVLGAFDGHVSPSRFLIQRFAEWGLPAEHMTVIENGLHEVTTLARGLRPEGVWTFGYFGQINPFKGLDVLLDAAELLAADKQPKTLRIRIHGNLVGVPQSFRDRFERVQRELPFVTYNGPYNGDSVYRLMTDCDYVVVPSKWWENSPVVIQEAFAVRTPVICSGIGGLAEKVANGVAGLHFKVGDAADLVRALKVAADPKLSDKLRSGIPPVSSGADMARQYLRLFANRNGAKPVAISDSGA
jgi:glycosyltransferase involved in cell wall biosynthesis